MTNPQEYGRIFKVRALSQNQPTDIELRPSKAEMAQIASELDLIDVRKVLFSGQLKAAGKNDWTLSAHLGATVVQPCVVTLEPVTTRIETDVTRHYLAEMPELGDEEEVEMPEDENAEQLGSEIDVSAVLFEALALNLPLFPRAEGAKIDSAVFTEPGKKAMTDEEARPFASLAALRDKLGPADEE
ncbi:uncharacterized metal-binding protein YceD (DUF177 family) [Shimia isoporae]|uniref:Uncharacterized metal-binding protein YceD (DUF177 family) n=1 Tax=Shimia isoporae TaxID=647720 RepID=A0A4R1NX10_9RHOB|nr:DUF177 domain-containing protein [Shimia isoporae]TCL09692.1 uncharacterized metal-binding protein YceD (DUF177 family) [Shimia isoporae]